MKREGFAENRARISRRKGECQRKTAEPMRPILGKARFE